MKSAAVHGQATDGATGQPLRANPAASIYRKPDASAPDTMALTRFRDAEGLDSGDAESVELSPDEEGIAAAEARAHHAAWYHRYFGTPQELVPQPYARPLA